MCNKDEIEYIQSAEKVIIKIVQHSFFEKEIKSLSQNQPISKNSQLLCLCPFLDDDGMLRVSGRLNACNQLSDENKHQLILPICNFTKRLILKIHQENLHCGQLATMSHIRQKYWPLKAKSIIRQVIYRCIKCVRYKATACSQLMGQLPADRVNAESAFINVSVDYAGPFEMKSGITRNTPRMKVYVALYKCMSTKAIHLELVTDATTEAFLASLNRFISRRGLPKVINSDNGSCFKGADNQFKEVFSKIKDNLVEFYKEKQIKWKFITPYAPHSAGFWESGIKQMKYHLKRIMENNLLTYEEFSTLLCRIEAILNSRPLSPLSEDPTDLNVLTLGHFLIGFPLNSQIEKDFSNISSNRLQRWEKIQQLQQKFWQQWYNDIVIHQQLFPKSFQQKHFYKLNELVLIKEPNLPPMKWQMGRIIMKMIFKGGQGVKFHNIHNIPNFI